MQKLTITARMKSPIVVASGYLTLDGILAAILFDRGFVSPEEAAELVPVKRTSDGLFYASAAEADVIQHGRFTAIAALHAAHDLDPALILRKKGKIHTKIGLAKKREGGNVISHYRTIAAPTVTWSATGDGEAIQKLLDTTPAIGARRHAGAGAVEQWTVEEGDLDGLEDFDGKPMRPVPIELWHGDKTGPITDAGWRPAYWNIYHRAPCYAPEGL